MPPPDSKREQLISLLHGPSMEVTVRLGNTSQRSWSLPKALLSHHSGFFQRACRRNAFLEGDEGKIQVTEADPETFELFVEFMYFGRYTFKDDLKDHMRIRDSARAWVLGDFLDSIEFKNFAMKNLYNIYKPDMGRNPVSGIGPRLIDFVCSRSLERSALWNFFLDVMVVYWHSNEIIRYDMHTKEEWDTIWERHELFRNELLFYTNQEEVNRASKVETKEYYLESVTSDNETAK